MKRALLLMALASTLFAQYNTNSESLIKTSVKEMSMASAEITDMNTYNTYDHAGIAVGIMEFETVKTRLNFGYKRLGLKTPIDIGGTTIDHKYAVNAITAPHIRVGLPDRFYADIRYSINPLTETQFNSTAGTNPSKSMPFSDFGLYLFGQMPDGRVRLGIGGQGFIGRERWGSNNSSRSVLGAENIGIMMGFNLHEAVNLTLAAHAGGWFDSLYAGADGWDNMDKDLRYQERFAFLQLPQIDIALDVGQHDLPYLANFAMTYAKNHFVYTLKWNQPAATSLSGDNEPGDFDPIKVDSLGMHMKHLWMADLGDAGELRPALAMGFFEHWSKHMEAGDDNFPMYYNGPRRGWELKMGSFNWDAGLAYSAKEIVDVWFEYGMNTLSIDLRGGKLTEQEESGAIIVPETEIYNRVGLGIKTNFDKYPSIDMQGHTFYLLAGFFMRQENLQFGTYRDWAMKYMYDLSGSGYAEDAVNGELNRYQPWETMKTHVQTTNINFGLGATFAEKAFEIDLHVGILNQKIEEVMDSDLDIYSDDNKLESFTYKGVEFGFDFIYNLQGKRNLASEKKVMEKTEEESDNTEGVQQ